MQTKLGSYLEFNKNLKYWSAHVSDAGNTRPPSDSLHKHGKSMQTAHGEDLPNQEFHQDPQVVLTRSGNLYWKDKDSDAGFVDTSE